MTEPAIGNQASIPADNASWRDRVSTVLSRRPPSLTTTRRDQREQYFEAWRERASRVGIDDDQAVWRHAVALKGTTTPTGVLDVYAASILLVLTAAVFFGGLFAPIAWLGAPSGVGEWATVVALWAVLEVFLAALFILLLADGVGRVVGEKGQTAAWVTLGGLCVSIVAALGSAKPAFRHDLAYAVSAAAFSGGLFVVVFIFFVLFIAGFGLLLGRVAIRRHPDSVFVRTTLDAIAAISDSKGTAFGSHRDLSLRGDAVRRLETAAIAAERLPRLLHAHDSATRAWIQDEAAQIASAIRFHKRSVLMPSAGDEMSLARLNTSLARLEQTARLAIAGDWEHIERKQVMQVSRGSRLRTFVSTSVIAIGPLAGALLLRQFGVFKDAVGSYAVAVTAVWFALTYLARYDPLFSTKVGAAADYAKLGR